MCISVCLSIGRDLYGKGITGYTITSICVCVYLYVYLYVYAYTCVRGQRFVCQCMDAYMYIVRVYICLHVYMSMYMSICILYMYMYTCMPMLQSVVRTTMIPCSSRPSRSQVPKYHLLRFFLCRPQRSIAVKYEVSPTPLKGYEVPMVFLSKKRKDGLGYATHTWALGPLRFRVK